MAVATNAAAPLSERFNLEDVVSGLVSDLAALRAGKITIEDARVRAELAKQMFNGVRLVVNVQKVIELRLKHTNEAPQ